MAIISISRQMGSLGTKIATKLQEKLGYNFLDKALLEKELISKYGIPEDKAQRYDEKKPGFWEMFSSDKDRYLHFLKTSMYEFARNGNCLIMGRGGQMLFQDVPGALHVKIVAPFKLRVERVKEQFDYNDHMAKKVIRHYDRDREGFHKVFFHVDWEDARLYDLTINTQHFTVYAAAKIIEDACNSASILEHKEEGSRKLEDLCLGQQVYTTIVYTEKLALQFVDVQVKDAVVNLQGAASTTDDLKRCEELVSKIPGVKQVVNELHHFRTTFI